MDSAGNIGAHSEEKLALYKEYLERYLSVLTTSQYRFTVLIVDLFAGCGVSKNDKEGSAVVAAKVIHEYRQKQKETPIFFRLNDIDPDKTSELENNLSDYNFPQTGIYQKRPPTKIHNKSADDFVSEFSKNNPEMGDVRCLFFIDPFGYTQLSQGNLNKLMSNKSIEILLFIPISSIYRFSRRKDPPKIVKPVLDFLTACGIRGVDIQSQNDLISALKDSFRHRAESPFVYGHTLRSEKARNSQFCLFFITHNEVGADKFIEARYTIKQRAAKQHSLFYFIDPPIGEDRSVKEFLSDWRDNREINKWRRESGYHNPEVNPYLAELEQQGKLEVESLGDSKRRKAAFYLTDKQSKIRVRIKNHE